MPDTHLVLYDSATGYVHAIYDLAVTGAWDNSGTYEADGFVDTATGAHVATDLGANMRCKAMDTPALDNSDFEGYGALEVDDATTPTDTQERTDADRSGGVTGTKPGKDGDLPDYTYTP